MFLFVSCHCRRHDLSQKKESPEFVFLGEETETYNSDTLTVELEGGIKLLWDSKNDEIIKDSVFYALRGTSINKNIVKSISDTTNLYVSVCSKKSNLRKGDVAFIALLDLDQLHVGRDLGCQFCEIYDSCKYLDGMLDGLENNREEIAEKLLTVFFK
jgi:hypothetical protein